MRSRDVPLPSFSLVLAQKQSHTPKTVRPRNRFQRASGLSSSHSRVVEDKLMRTVDDRLSNDTWQNSGHGQSSRISLPTIYEQDETAVTIDVALHPHALGHSVGRKRRISLTDTVIDLAIAVIRKFVQ
ncbi:hypothetical protein PAXINDRAFT_95135 [Paxillus involutus ATCC 200175]|nr:hypothetical protein PAXINDRAFT_95135 [Paxillus involutus ATCC 200175]